MGRRHIILTKCYVDSGEDLTKTKNLPKPKNQYKVCQMCFNGETPWTPWTHLKKRSEKHLVNDQYNDQLKY